MTRRPRDVRFTAGMPGRLAPASFGILLVFGCGTREDLGTASAAVDAGSGRDGGTGGRVSASGGAGGARHVEAGGEQSGGRASASGGAGGAPPDAGETDLPALLDGGACEPLDCDGPCATLSWPVACTITPAASLFYMTSAVYAGCGLVGVEQSLSSVFPRPVTAWYDAETGAQVGVFSGMGVEPFPYKCIGRIPPPGCELRVCRPCGSPPTQSPTDGCRRADLGLP